MLVTPTPVCLLIVVVELGKDYIFAMALFSPRTIRLVFMAAPLMIVVVLFVVVGLVIFGSQRGWRYRHRRYKCGAQHGRVQEMGHRCFHNGCKATAVPLFADDLVVDLKEQITKPSMP